MHFSNPAPFIPGVELIAHAGTDEAVVQAAEALVARTGKLSARVNDKAGFVLNRLQYVLLKEAINLVEEGVATAEDIDIVVRTTFGYRLSVLRPVRHRRHGRPGRLRRPASARSRSTTASGWPRPRCSPSWSTPAATG